MGTLREEEGSEGRKQGQGMARINAEEAGLDGRIMEKPIGCESVCYSRNLLMRTMSLGNVNSFMHHLSYVIKVD